MLVVLVPVATAAAAPGDLDPSFGTGGTVRTVLRDSSEAWALDRQSTGKLIVVGASHTEGPDARFEVLRYLSNGSLDPTFGGGDGVASISFPGDPHTVAHAVAVRPNDRIVVAGEANSGFGVAQLTPDGDPDDTFGTDGRVVLHPSPEGADATALALAPDGQVIVAGQAEARHHGTGPWVDTFAAARIEPDGALDTSFGDGGQVLVEMTETAPNMFSGAVFSQLGEVVRYSDGRIALIGSAYDDWADDEPSIEHRFRLAIARLNEDGELDASFSGDGKLTALGSGATHTTGRAGALATNGMLVVGGWSTPTGTYVARLADDGSVDPSFGAGGSAVVSPLEPVALSLQSDGKVVAAGPFEVDGFGVVRLMPAGALDSGFGASGFAKGPPVEGHAYPNDLLLEPGGDIVVAGSALIPGEEAHIALARYQGDRLVPDGDRDGFPNAQDRCPDVPGIAPDGCPEAALTPMQPPSASSRGIRFRAIGDSVTAGFGYDDGGHAVPGRVVRGFCKGDPSSPRCQSPNGTAYPAFFVNKLHRSGIAVSDWRNLAMSGSTPDDWLTGHLRKRLRGVVADNPDLTALTLGANPALSDAITKVGPACSLSPSGVIGAEIQLHLCIRAILVGHKVKTRVIEVLRKLLVAKTNHVVVFAYQDTTVPLVRSFVEELNRAVGEAVKQVRRDLDARDRILFVSPGPFAKHGCLSRQPWVSRADCIHPNAEGYQQFAAALLASARRWGLF